MFFLALLIKLFFMKTKLDKENKTVILPAKDPSNLIFAEVNLEKLPVFAPYKNKKFKNNSLTCEYTREIVENGKAIQLKWKVSANPEYGGYLNHFDRDIFRCLQKIINNKGLTSDCLIAFSIYEIVEMLGKKQSGKLRKEIKKSILKIRAAVIESNGVFFDKETGSNIDLYRQFNIFDSLYCIGQRLPSGEIAETNYLKLNELILNSMCSGYVKLVDFDYYMSLKSSIAKALYSRLSIDFYGLKNKSPFLKKRYSKLCEEVIITYQKYPSLAKQALKPALNELTKSGFFSKVEFEPIPNTKHDFYIKFYPGKRAKEPNSFKKIYPRPVEVFEPQQDKKLLTTNNNNNTPVCHCEEPKIMKQSHNKEIINIINSVKDELSEEDLFILNSLLDAKVTKPAALECVKDHKEKTKYWLKAKDVDERYQKATNKAGFILRAIRYNWSSPYYEKSLASKKQQNSSESQAQQKEIEKRRQELRELEEKQKFDELYNSLTDIERDKIESKILDRLKENAFLYNQYRKKGLTTGIKETLKSYRYEKVKMPLLNHYHCLK